MRSMKKRKLQEESEAAMTNTSPQMTMGQTKKRIEEALSSMNSLIEAHKGYAELGDIKGNSVVIHCGGQCTDCDTRCIEDAIHQNVPGIEVIFR